MYSDISSATSTSFLHKKNRQLELSKQPQYINKNDILPFAALTQSSMIRRGAPCVRAQLNQFLLLRRAHHHLAELVKVHGAAAVLVELLDDAVQLFLREGGQQLANQATQRLHRDETLASSVVDPVRMYVRWW